MNHALETFASNCLTLRFRHGFDEALVPLLYGSTVSPFYVRSSALQRFQVTIMEGIGWLPFICLKAKVRSVAHANIDNFRLKIFINILVITEDSQQ